MNFQDRVAEDSSGRLVYRLDIRVGARLSGSVVHFFTLIDHNTTITMVTDGFRTMGDKNNGTPALVQLTNPRQALFLERHIADGQYFVDQENRRIEMHRDRKSKTHEHPARIVFHRHVNFIAKLGKIDDRTVRAFGDFFTESEDRRIQKDVFVARELVMKTRSEFDQRRDPLAHLDLAAGGLVNPAQKLEDGALAGSVPTHDTDKLTRFDFERNIVEYGKAVFLSEIELSPQRLHEDRFERIGAVAKILELFRNVLKVNQWREVNNASRQTQA